MSDSHQAMAANLPPSRREEFVAYMNRTTDHAKIDGLMVDALVKTFTTEELDALASFRGSPLYEAKRLPKREESPPAA